MLPSWYVAELSSEPSPSDSETHALLPIKWIFIINLIPSYAGPHYVLGIV